jgi:hypothetical protein
VTLSHPLQGLGALASQLFGKVASASLTNESRDFIRIKIHKEIYNPKTNIGHRNTVNNFLTILLPQSERTLRIHGRDSDFWDTYAIPRAVNPIFPKENPTAIPNQ